MITEIDLDTDEAVRRGRDRVLAYCGFTLFNCVRITSARLYLDQRGHPQLQMPFKFRRRACPVCHEKIERDSVYCRRCGGKTGWKQRDPRAIGPVVRLDRDLRNKVIKALIQALEQQHERN